MDRTRQNTVSGNRTCSNVAFTLVEMLVLLVIIAFVMILKTNMAVGWQNNVHVRAGNVLLCDGSVQQTLAAGLPGFLSRSDMATNRLVVP